MFRTLALVTVLLAGGARAMPAPAPDPALEARIRWLVAQLGEGDTRASDARFWSWGSGSSADEAATELARIGRPAVEKVLPVLRDPMEWRRVFAIDILERIRDPRAFAPLVRAFEAETVPAVRAHLADALGALEVRAGAGALIDGLRDEDEWAQAAAARALGRLKAASAIPGLIALLGTGYIAHVGRDPAEEAYRALARLGPPARSPLREALKSANPFTRAHAALALGDMRERRAVPDILALLGDTDPYVKQSAVQALGRIGDRRAVEHLLPLLTDADGMVSCAAVEALGAIGDPRALPAVLTRLEDEEMADCVVRALGGFRDPRAVDALLRVVAGALDGRVEDSWSRNMLRCWAAESLTQIGDRRAVPPLVDLLASAEADVRHSAMRALGRMKARTALPVLRARLRHPDDASEAAEAIGRLSLREGLALLRDREARVRQTAADALGSVGETRAVDALIAALDDPVTRTGAFQSLVRLGAVRVLPRMMFYVEDPDPSVRRMAVLAVADLQTLARGGRLGPGADRKKTGAVLTWP